MNDHTAEVRSSRNLRRGAHQLLELYRGHWGQLFWAAFWFTVKHSPAWVTPIVIANIINIVTDPEHHNLTQFWLNLIVVAAHPRQLGPDPWGGNGTARRNGA